MKIGTKSLLFGAHCFFLHPWFVAAAWWKLYGFPWDIRLWVAFFVHDWGYWGKPNMDGPEGESHILLGARILSTLFDAQLEQDGWTETCPYSYHWERRNMSWEQFALFHSRSVARRARRPVSKLGMADKLAIVFTPWWLYLPLVWLTGEVREYRKASQEGGKYASMSCYDRSWRVWYGKVQDYLKAWVNTYREGRTKPETLVSPPELPEPQEQEEPAAAA